MSSRPICVLSDGYPQLAAGKHTSLSHVKRYVRAVIAQSHAVRDVHADSHTGCDVDQTPFNDC